MVTDVLRTLLVLRNTGHTAELPRHSGDSYKVDGHSLTRAEFLALVDPSTTPTQLF